MSLLGGLTSGYAVPQQTLSNQTLTTSGLSNWHVYAPSGLQFTAGKSIAYIGKNKDGKHLFYVIGENPITMIEATTDELIALGFTITVNPPGYNLKTGEELQRELDIMRTAVGKELNKEVKL